MAKIIECVPNISEGRDLEKVEACINEIRNTPGVTLLDYSSDASHNRSIIIILKLLIFIQFPDRNRIIVIEKGNLIKDLHRLGNLFGNHTVLSGT